MSRVLRGVRLAALCVRPFDVEHFGGHGKLGPRPSRFVWPWKERLFRPEYWRIRHLAVLDLQKQVGLPYLFRTRAPYERSFPYHQWVLDEMAKTGRGREIQVPFHL